MDNNASLPIFRFSTEPLSQHEKFDAWRNQLNGIIDLEAPDDPTVHFDASMQAVQLGQFVAGQRIWKNSARQVPHRARRSTRHIRADGLDYYCLELHQSELIQGWAGTREVNVCGGQLLFLDRAKTADYSVTLGDTIYMIVPRSILPVDMSALHGQTLTSGLAGLLADYMQSLHARLARMSVAEMPYVAQATADILRACLQPAADSLAQAQSELDALRFERVKRYIDAHLLEPDLGPDRICKEIGISRSSLYRLFESTTGAGVSHVILQKRLRRARSALADPTSLRARIGEVARRHGFVNEKHFSRVFKAEFDCTPREMQDRAVRCARMQPSVSTDLQNPTFSAWMTAFLDHG
ncbi:MULTISPECIES: helix-turn-helix domain-containing protein [unclassified Burkholderia]|uniref:helix-turn-helix domain-containing protein n=1 Tax=unclassified Burkholderia TaxID=2613784 RepID=UPI000ABAF825|nr:MULTISPECIES: AraC family transcriptional regulator [unclassified Burkholderia]